MITTWCQDRLAHLDHLDYQGVSRGRRRQILLLTIRTARRKAAFIRELQDTGNRRKARSSVGWRPGAITNHRRQDPAFAALDECLAGASAPERQADKVMSLMQVYLLDCETLALIAQQKLDAAPAAAEVAEIDLAELLREAAEVLDPTSADETRRRLARQLIDAAADVARLQRIEEAASAALDSGAAWYAAEEQWVGDLVPADVMTALREVMDGAVQRTDAPPAASQRYAERLELALLLREAEDLLDPTADDDARLDCARRLVLAAEQIERGDWTRCEAAGAPRGAGTATGALDAAAAGAPHDAQAERAE